MIGSFRGGCWFCVKQPLSQLYNIFTNYPDLWEELKKLEKNSNVSFKPNKTLEQIELKFKEKKYGK